VNKNLASSSVVPMKLIFFGTANPTLNKAGALSRKDANFERINLFRKVMGEGVDKYFTKTYGGDQLYLQLLGTHPDHRRRGYGTALCNWGISLAKDDGVVVSLFASPMGFLLYSQLGFKYLGTLTIQVLGETDKVILKAMVLENEVKEISQADELSVEEH
jgi:GNAT superfamily N-acetyltransferase